MSDKSHKKLLLIRSGELTGSFEQSSENVEMHETEDVVHTIQDENGFDGYGNYVKNEVHPR